MKPLLRVRQVLFAMGRFGILGTAHQFASYVLPYHYGLYGLNLTASRVDGERRAATAGLSVRVGDLDELKRWAEQQPHVPLYFLAYKFSAARVFWWALVGGEPAGIVWGVREHSLLLLGPEEAAIVGLTTRSGYQRAGIGLALLHAACEGLRGLGYRRAYATIEPANLVSRRLFARAGFANLGEFSHVWPWTMRRSVPPLLDVSMSPQKPGTPVASRRQRD